MCANEIILIYSACKFLASYKRASGSESLLIDIIGRRQIGVLTIKALVRTWPLIDPKWNIQLRNNKRPVAGITTVIEPLKLVLSQRCISEPILYE